MAATLTVIWWRDIPAQVVAKDGRRASKVVLHPRFQVAIDRAAVKSARREMDAYIAEWRKEQRRCGDDLETAAHDEATRLEAEYTNDVLKRLVANGGLAEGDGLVPPDAAAAELAAGAAADTAATSGTAADTIPSSERQDIP